MDEEPIQTLNVIPFVDIMLVLLTIVLTTANFVATGRVPVSLPQAASQAQVEKHQDKTIDLTVDGGLYFDNQAVSKDELVARLSVLPAGTSFLVRADRAIQFQQFVDVTEILKKLNFTRVAVQTKKTAS
jgi:biopolymer transport protein ExbD